MSNGDPASLASNPKSPDEWSLEDARKYAAEARERGHNPEDVCNSGWLVRLDAEIERLTRERDSAREALRISEQRVREHWSERDRLRHERNAAHRKADRLLTALKSIRDLRYSAFRTYQQNTEDMRAIASRALALPSEPNSAPETCELRMADGTPLYDYLRNAVPESTPMDDWTRGFEECKRRLFDIVGPQLRPPLKANDPSSINEAK